MNNVFDLHHQIKPLISLDTIAIITNSTVPGIIIDTAGFTALDFVLLSGTIVGDGIFTTIMEHGNDSGLSDATTVPAAEILGSAVFIAADTNTAKCVGYIGKKRYIRLCIVLSDRTVGGGTFTGAAILGGGIHQPVVD